MSETDLITVSEGKGENEGTFYYNMDFRGLEYNVPQEVVLLYPEPSEGDFIAKKSGKTVHYYNFGLAVNGKRVGAFAYDYYKGITKGKSFVSVLKGFEEGDVLEITKKEGRVQSGEYKGTEFKMWKVEKTGNVDVEEFGEGLSNPEDDGVTTADTPHKATKPKKKSSGPQKKKSKELTDKEIAKILDDADFESKPANIKDVRDNVDTVTKENVEKYLSG